MMWLSGSGILVGAQVSGKVLFGRGCEKLFATSGFDELMLAFYNQKNLPDLK